MPRNILTLLIASGLGLVGAAQPSGGPYGPVQQVYQIPADAARVHYVAPDGRADSPGRSVDDPTTIESAIERAVTNDAIILRGGVYRTGDLVFNQGITIQPYEGERPILKGSRVAGQWTALRDNIWRTDWDTLFPLAPESWWRREREGMRTPVHRFNNDMVFVDGRMLQSAGWEGEVDEDTFFVNYETGHVFIGVDPTDKTIEITAFDNAITRTIGEVHGRESDGIGPTIRGLTMTQYAYRAIEIEGYDPEGPSPESAHGKDVVGTLLEHLTITFCSRVGGYFRGDNLVIRNCLVSDTSTEGIFILSSNDVLLERNIIKRNNIENITGYYPAAVKIFNQCYRVVCRDNLVLEQPNSNGIWYDVGNVDGVFINNWIQDAQDGFFFEISTGAICAGNVFVNCDKGVRVLNAAGVHVFQNTFVDSVASFERSTRSAVGDHFDWHPATGPDVDERHSHRFAGNLLVATEGFDKALLRFEQVPALCGVLTDPAADELDHNVFVRPSTRHGREGLIVWSPAEGVEDCTRHLNSPSELHSLHPDFAANDILLADYRGPLFQSIPLSRFKLQEGFPAIDSGYDLSGKVRELLDWEDIDTLAPGAYQPR